MCGQCLNRPYGKLGGGKTQPHDWAASSDVTCVEDVVGLSSIEIYGLYSHQHSIQLLLIYPVLLYSHSDHPECVYSDGD